MSDKDKKGISPKTYKFDTLSLHAGYQPHKNAVLDKFQYIKQPLICLMMLIMPLLFLI